MADVMIENLNVFNSAMGKAEFKEKFGRVLQYGARMISGILTDADKLSPSKDRQDLISKINSFQSVLGDARRTFRFFKELSVAPTIPKDLQEADPVNLGLTVCSKLSLLAFFMADHYLWLQKAKIVRSGNAADTLKTAMKFFLVTHTLNFALQMKKLKEMLDSAGTSKYSEAKKNQLVQQCVKSLLLMVQAAHISGVFETNNTLVGLAGVISSGMDCKQMWDAEVALVTKKQ
jgi:alpha-D-ribose 1-methylphosphonate 5-triphosphate synthase subunit PhnH